VSGVQFAVDASMQLCPWGPLNDICFPQITPIFEAHSIHEENEISMSTD
jgi:hypothetical protein